MLQKRPERPAVVRPSCYTVDHQTLILSLSASFPRLPTLPPHLSTPTQTLSREQESRKSEDDSSYASTTSVCTREAAYGVVCVGQKVCLYMYPTYARQLIQLPSFSAVIPLRILWIATKMVSAPPVPGIL